MAHMAHSHVSVHAIFCKLEGHNSASRIVDQDVESVCGIADLLGDLHNSLPVTQVALNPLRSRSLVLAQLLLHGISCAINDLFGDTQNEQLGYVLGKKSVRASISDS